MNEQTLPVSQTAGAEMLLGFWYPAVRSTAVRGQRLETALLLGVPLVMGRDARGQPFALRDTCPHRGMPLSFGHFDGEQLECCYHGWQFAVENGQCRAIPSLTADSKLKVERIFAARYPCEEQDGHIWVFLPDPASRDAPVPPAPRLPVFSDRYRSAHLSCELPCNVDHGIIGLMDPAHGPFVHQSWRWRSRRSIQEKEKVFEPIPNGFRMRAHTPSANSAPYKLLRIFGEEVTTTIEFVLPNMRFEQVRCGARCFEPRYRHPHHARRSRIDFVAAWNLFPWLPLEAPIFRFFGRRFLRQDQETMIKQAEGLRHNPAMMLIDDADRPAKWYFQLKAAHLESKRTGQPMVHPLTGPVSLRWRS